jgi:hypothetical protein
MLSALAHRMLRKPCAFMDNVCICEPNTCVSLDITKTYPEDHATLLAFHALRLRFTFCILVQWRKSQWGGGEATAPPPPSRKIDEFSEILT